MYKASAPGSLMVGGEHAVLQNKKAIVLAVNQRIQVTLHPRADLRIFLYSALGNLELDWHALEIRKPFEFVIAAIALVKEQLPSGFELRIEAEFKENLGLGSSAAVTVATLAVLYLFVAQEKSEPAHDSFQLKVFTAAKAVIQTVQGLGSGADAAASVYGGVILYQMYAPYILRKIAAWLPLTVVYSGFKTATREVVRQVAARRDRYPEVFAALYTAIENAVLETASALEKQDWLKAGELLNIQQGLMQALGVVNSPLNALVESLIKQPNVYGVKVSGSGLGDCVIALHAPETRVAIQHGQEIPLSVSQQGLSTHYE